MSDLKKEYRDLEMKVLRQLREKIEQSTIKSKHVDSKVIKVNVFYYTELAIINDQLTFMDNNGLHYSVFNDLNLEELIDILNS